MADSNAVNASPDLDLTSHPFSEEAVRTKEEKEIIQQRQLRKMPGATESTHLTGLALSGGGIRSATFSLGVLQTLCKLPLSVLTKTDVTTRPLIEFVDYLSTVSGGGYIGSWFVANRRRERQEMHLKQRDTKAKKLTGVSFAVDQSADENCTGCETATEPVAHLRRYSHYLNPDPGVMSADTWTMVTIWLRNTVLIQAMVFCVVACCFMLPHLWLRVVNGVTWLLDDNKDGQYVWMNATSGISSFRWTEGMFPLAILVCLGTACWHARKEVQLFFEDKKVDSGDASADSIKPIDQARVQKRIVLPAVVAALLTTLWLWLHHERLNAQQKLIEGLKQAEPAITGNSYLDSWMSAIQGQVRDVQASEVLKEATLANWASGLETTSILASPWMLLLTLAVALMAQRLMWLKEDKEAQEARGGPFWPAFCRHLGSRIAFWLSTNAPRPEEPGPVRKAWKPWLAQMRREGLRRVLFYVALLCGSLFSLYLIDEAFRSLHETKIAFSRPEPEMHLELEMPRGQLSADYTAVGATRNEFEIGIGLAAVLGPAMMVLKYIFMLILALGLAGRRMFDNVREWWSRVGAWLMIYSMAILALCGISLFGPIVFDWIGDRLSVWVQGGVVTGWLATLVTTLLMGRSEKSGNEKKTPVINLDNAALVVLLGLLFGGAWIVRFMLTPEGFSPQGDDPLLLQTLAEGRQGWWRFGGVFAGLLVAAAVLVWRVDLNEFSMNHFYRNRLVRCYLGGATHRKDDRRPHPFTGFEFRDDQPLACFTTAESHPGPYPLINTALNTSQGGDLDVQERKAESFLLSPLFCGSQRRRLTIPEKEKSRVNEGFRPTRLYMSGGSGDKAEQDPDMSGNGPHPARAAPAGIKIGTAMSISGAAASPNSGYHTSPVLAFLMTIFNARLGWWVPNPAKNEKALWQRQAPAFPGYLKYLTFELFGSATPDSGFVYLSDGGHFENLGIYELVRRRCRFIIAIDGEQDGDFTFHALGTAIRRCRVDFDAEIEIGVDELRPNTETGFSRSHCAVGKIHYADAPDGTLLYIKSSLTGDESTDIVQYKKMFPAFPHESTGDQFFSESQFESYRKLGQHAAQEALAPLRRERMAAGEPPDPTSQLRHDLEEHWFRAAKAPNEAFISHTDDLDAIWASLTDQDVPPCIAQIVLPRAADTVLMTMPEDAQERLKVVCFGQRLIQLMENVCLDLKLSARSAHPDHTGWVRLFKGWANHPVLQQVWNESKETYGSRFAHFWEDLQDVPAATKQPPGKPKSQRGKHGGKDPGLI